MVHYRVQLGDSLWDLAHTFYGDLLQWTRILDAKWSNIADPDRLEIGLLLEIPLGG
jgi:nucleoid-associated protein YgaU